MKKKKLIIGSLIAGVLIYFLFRQLDLQKLHDLKIVINFQLLLMAFILYIISNIMRAKRFNFVLGNQLQLVEMFRITSFYNLYTGLLPGGIGELSFIYFIKQKIKQHMPVGLSSVVITRIYDILITAFFLLGSTIVLTNLRVEKGIYVFLVSIIIVTLLFIIKYIDAIIVRFIKLGEFFIKSDIAWLNKAKEAARLAANILKENKNKKIPLFFITFLFWGINFLIIELSFRAIGVPLSYFEAVFMGTILHITTIIPLNTLAGFGYKETGLALGLIFIGFVKHQAILHSFFFHLLTILFMVLLAFIGLLMNVKTVKIRKVIELRCL